MQNRRSSLFLTAVAIGLMSGSLVGMAKLPAISGAQHHATPDKAKNCSSSNPCLDETNSSNGPGVEGNSTNGPGVVGYSPNYYGVIGSSDAFDAAVGGFNSDTSGGSSGVYGTSTNGFGVTGYAPNGYSLYGDGNVLVNGEIYTNGACHSGCSRTRHEASFGSRSSQPTIDDVGESALRTGIVHVALASDFANAIDASKPYVVLLTPEGDASLYVSGRTATGFDVRQIGGGRSSVAFAYRIVAKPYGVSDERLPFKTVRDVSTLAVRHARL